jgi:long-chain fatty acid transport protein
MKKLSTSTLLMALAAGPAFAGGFQVNLQGTRQIAMGGTAAAVPLDAATVFYNPAGMAVLGGSQVYVGGFYLKSYTDFVQTPTGSGKYTTESPAGTPFNVYFMHQLRGKLSKLSLGLSVNTPFGSGVKWPQGWTGQYLINEIKLRSYFFQPTLAYKVSDHFSFGAGVVYARGTVELGQSLPLTATDNSTSSALLKGSGSGWGFNAGVHASYGKFTLGLNYRSQVDMKVENGDATFTVPSTLSANFPATNKFSTSLPLPQNFSVAIGYKPTAALTLQAQMDYLGWSAYRDLSFDYENNTAALKDTKRTRNWNDRAVYRFGAMYKATSMLDVMAGYAYDRSPVPDGYFSAETPDANRNIVTAGVAVHPTSKLTVSGTFYYTATQKRDVYNMEDNFSGRIQTKAAAGGLGISYNF